MRILFFLLLPVLSVHVALVGQGITSRLQDDYQLKIEMTDESISVDGALTEGVWQTAQRATDFWMTFSIDDRRAPAEHQAEAMITYDDKYIYIGAICHRESPYVMPYLKCHGYLGSKKQKVGGKNQLLDESLNANLS